MSKSDDRRLDAYLAGEQSPQEQRALAQAALDDPELFDRLASAAAVNAAAKGAAIGSRRANKVPLRWLLTGAAATAAIIVAVVSIDLPRSTPALAPSATTAAPSRAATDPAAAPATAAPQPVLLTARLGDLAKRPPSEFRSVGDTSRAPKSSGVVVGIDDGEVAIDLGSLDGLTKGSEVPVTHRGASTTARLTVTTVFRERSRGRIVSSDTVQVGDRVGLPADLQLSALLEHALSRIAAGDADAARAVAKQAVAVSSSAAGAESPDAMNELAAVLINNRDYADAESLLLRAQMSATGLTAVRVANNLGALAATRGDVSTATSMYRSALTLARTTAEYESARSAIEQNLQALRPTQ
jgi:hypothetical protein